MQIRHFLYFHFTLNTKVSVSRLYWRFAIGQQLVMPLLHHFPVLWELYLGLSAAKTGIRGLYRFLNF